MGIDHLGRIRAMRTRMETEATNIDGGIDIERLKWLMRRC